jgi:hypothetical protein
MSTTNPKIKKALSKHFTAGYALSQVLKREPDVDENIEHLLRWVEKYAEDRMPMDLDRFITYTTFDNIGSALFSEPFGFIRAVCHVPLLASSLSPCLKKFETLFTCHSDANFYRVATSTAH